jgi:hypothetical protein
MTLCYDFQKWTMVTLGLVAISLSVGLILQHARGQSVDNQTTVNNTDFSFEVPNGWVYRENFPIFMNNTLLTPNEFADILITDNVSVMSYPFQSKVLVEIAPAPEVSFPIKNAPVEIYANYELKKITTFAHKSENASIGGERAIKVYTNGTELANGTNLGNATISAIANVTISVNSILPSSVSYYVVHNDQPYYLQYMSNDIKKYQKYLPQFEQMVKTFKFAK